MTADTTTVNIPSSVLPKKLGFGSSNRHLKCNICRSLEIAVATTFVVLLPLFFFLKLLKQEQSPFDILNMAIEESYVDVLVCTDFEISPVNTCGADLLMPDHWSWASWSHDGNLASKVRHQHQNCRQAGYKDLQWSS